MIVTIALNNGLHAIADEADADILAELKWSAAAKDSKSGGFYAIGWSKRLKRSIYMHRVILDAKRGQIIDHVNGDGLDNRRCNLRFADNSLNNANRLSYSPSSGFRGVYPVDKGRRFCARLWARGEEVYLGRFSEPREAAAAYDAAAVKAFGEFATLNFPKCGPHSQGSV